VSKKRAVFPAFSSREVTLGQMREIGNRFIIYLTEMSMDRIKIEYPAGYLRFFWISVTVDQLLIRSNHSA